MGGQAPPRTRKVTPLPSRKLQSRSRACASNLRAPHTHTLRTRIFPCRGALSWWLSARSGDRSLRCPVLLCNKLTCVGMSDVRVRLCRPQNHPHGIAQEEVKLVPVGTAGDSCHSQAKLRDPPSL